MKLKEFVIFLGMIFLCVGVAVGEISFIDPTPLNNSRIYNNHTNINVSIPVEDLTNFTFNWNETNTTYLNNSCVLHLSFDNNSEIGDNSTLIRDVSSYNNNGSFVNGSTGNWTADGVWNGAMNFDGVDDYVDCGNDVSLNITDAITIEAWMKCPDIDSFRGILAKKSNAEWFTKGYSLNLDNNGKFYFVLNDKEAESSTQWDDNKWHHVVAAWEKGGTLDVFVDGQETSYSRHDSLLNDIVQSVDNLKVGVYHGTNYFNGAIDEVRIYNRALTPEEIRQSYLSNLRKFNESQWYFETNQTDLQNFTTYNYQAFANNDTNNFATDLFNFYVMPYEEILNISCYSAYPETLYTNYTGFLNSSYIVESSYPLNMSSLAFLMGTNYTLTDDYHSYLKVPANTIANDGIYRAHNRNSTPYLSWESNDTITEGNVWKWGGGDNNDFWITNESINDTHIWVNITGIASNVFPSMFYLGRKALYESEKTGVEINKGQGVIFKIWDLEQLRDRNSDFWVRMFFDTQTVSTPSEKIDIWFCNNSFNPISDDPINCEYCLRLDTWSSTRWLDHEDYQPHNNVSYSKPLIYYAGEPLEIYPDNINYVYLTSNTQSSKSYILNITNSDPGICNITYAETQTMWLRDINGHRNAPYPYTPSFFMATVRDYLEFTHHLYIANDQGTWGHSDYYTVPIGISNVPPTHCRFNYFWWNDTTDYGMNGTYEENFNINLTYGVDPDNGASLTHVLSLYDSDYNFITFINDSLIGNQTDIDIFIDIQNHTSKYSAKCFRFKIVSTDNEGSTSVTWSNEFCIKRDSWFKTTIPIITGFPTAIGGILASFLSFLPLFVGILISGFLILVCVGIFGKLKRW